MGGALLIIAFFTAIFLLYLFFKTAVVVPQQNAFVESFNGRLRDELLNETLFTTLAQARTALAAWRIDYNTVRPHSGLGGRTPAEAARPTETQPGFGHARSLVAITARTGHLTTEGLYP